MKTIGSKLAFLAPLAVIAACSNSVLFDESDEPLGEITLVPDAEPAPQEQASNATQNSPTSPAPREPERQAMTRTMPTEMEFVPRSSFEKTDLISLAPRLTATVEEIQSGRVQLRAKLHLESNGKHFQDEVRQVMLQPVKGALIIEALRNGNVESTHQLVLSEGAQLSRAYGGSVDVLRTRAVSSEDSSLTLVVNVERQAASNASEALANRFSGKMLRVEADDTAARLLGELQ